MKISDLYLRRTFLFVLGLIWSVSSFSQNPLTLVFTGVDQNNAYVRLNNVTIQNLSKGWSETILFPDTVYTLNVGTGIEGVRSGENMQVMPNPFDGQTRVNIFSSRTEPVRMTLVDISGKQCAEYSGILVSGDNYYEISLTMPQVYVLTVVTASGSRSLKMVNKGHAAVNGITEAGNAERKARVELKSTSVHAFDIGDEMSYEGSTSYQNQLVMSAVVTHQQYSSEDIQLSFDLDAESVAMSVVTDSVIIVDQGVNCYGTVSSMEAVTVRGFCWSTAPHPTLDNDYTEEGAGQGSFASMLSGLNLNKLYYVRAYATGTNGTVYGNEFRFRQKVSYIRTDTVFLPDGMDCGNGCAYESQVTVTGYNASDMIYSANDIAFLRIKLEHSYIGDLWIALTCPNGQRAALLKKYNGGSSSCSGQIPSSDWGWNMTSGISPGAFLGDAHDGEQSDDDCNPNAPGNVMGTPWNYCWSNSTTNGYQYAAGSGCFVYESINVSNGIIDSTNTVSMTNVYHPDVSFANLIGCPMNGTWALSVMDGYNQDNGWLTEWELSFTDCSFTEAVAAETSGACPGTPTVSDYDGNVYNTIKIGSQCWMKENLRTTSYADGTTIPLGTEISEITPYHFIPYNDTTEVPLYGYLYNWPAVMHGASVGSGNTNVVQGICPDGWHVPSDVEWTSMDSYISGVTGYVCGDNPNNIAKALATDTLWNESDNTCAVGNDLTQNNTADFSALPAGYAYGIMSLETGVSGRFWTSSVQNDAHACYHALRYDRSYVERNSFGDKACGFSVRCVLSETPRVKTMGVSNIMTTTAECDGQVTSVGDFPVTESGICWGTNTYPTIADDKLICGSGLGTFSGTMTGLIPGTTYYVRAYATNASGTVYGTQESFTTYDVPVVTTAEIIDIWDSTAICGGNVTSDGGLPVTTRGVCWSTLPNPTFTDSHTNDGTGTGEFVSMLTGLNPGTNYYVRAYATNGGSTAYGAQKTFTSKTIPTVSLDSMTDILSTTASCTYHVTDTGGLSVTERGVCYGTTPNPTLSDSVMTGTGDNGTIQLSGLTPGTTYYVRTFATNAVGTAYSNQIAFNTLIIPTLTTAEITDISFFTATGGGEVLATGVPDITVRGICWSTSPNPTIANDYTTEGSGFGTFVNMLAGLSLHTKYYVRAFAINSSGTGYGNQVSFTTLNTPSVTTKAVTDILDSTATCGGNVTSDGGGVLLARGICWDTIPIPTVANFHTVDTAALGTGSYTSLMTGLNPGTAYFVRAYATNGGGTVYGSQKTFTTKIIPIVSLDSATDILSTTVSFTYYVTATGGLTVSSRGVCYSRFPNPTLSDSVMTGTGNNGTIQLSGLTPGTTYYVRAFATNAVGTGYSDQISFTTLTIPTLTTAEITDISFFTATGGGEVLATGVPEITARGVCWSTAQNPTISDSHTSDSVGSGIFTSTLLGLELNTTYYVRAYATNSSGTGYGNQVSFTTLNTPSVTTKAVTSISDSTATCGGNVTSDGGGVILAKGICWSTSQNPTMDDNLVTDTSAQNNYSCMMTGLNPGTTYYVRAFATNGGGTAYGVQKTFTTKAIPTVSLDSVTDILSTTASCTYHVTATGGLTVTGRGVCYGTIPNPTLSDSVMTGTGNNGTIQFSGLIPGTTYYVRAFATNAIGTAYSNQISFTTLTIPTLTTEAVSNVDFYTATCGGEVLATGVPDITVRGVCWSTVPNPTISDSHTSDGAGFGTFTSVLLGLELNTTYYVRAYATNSSGTGYGNQVSLTTLKLPTVTTGEVLNISDSMATCGGNVTSDGDATITARGVCWSTSPNPTILDNLTTDGIGTGVYTSNITGLTPATVYYVRAYATCAIGTAYGNEVSFITQNPPCPGAATVTDIDNNTYNTVLIGNQCWMKENLRTTRYADGTTISLGTEISEITSYRYSPVNGEQNVPVYGYLYNWPAVMYGANSSDINPSGVQGICPDGWHVPSDAEWTQLTNYVRSQTAYLCGNNVNYISKALADTTGWSANTFPCTTGNDQSTNNATGFSALPAGSVGAGGGFVGAYFWSATETSTSYAYPRHLFHTQANVYREPYGKDNGCSVRCLRDTSSSVIITTNSVSDILATTATCGGCITYDGVIPITARGVCWSTSPNPTIADNHTIDGSGMGLFYSNITGLTPLSEYYVRAYAISGQTVIYGNVVMFMTPNPYDGQPCSGPSIVTDIDNNTYNTVQIGNQCWMKENLRTTCYADGTTIPLGSSTSTITPYRYNPDNDANNVPTYGYLYNWPAVMHGTGSSISNPSGVQGICPSGWHVPSEAEWTQLRDYVSSRTQYQCGNNSVNIAKALAATIGWNTGSNTCAIGNNPDVNNAIGFSALPAGYGNYGFGYIADFWSATESSEGIAYNRSLNYNAAYIIMGCYSKDNCYSVRCLRD